MNEHMIIMITCNRLINNILSYTTRRSSDLKLVWAELLEVTSPAKQRGKAKCPHFQKCGGCHYQHIPAEEQLRLKKEILRETDRKSTRLNYSHHIISYSVLCLKK